MGGAFVYKVGELQMCAVGLVASFIFNVNVSGIFLIFLVRFKLEAEPFAYLVFFNNEACNFRLDIVECLVISKNLDLVENLKSIRWILNLNVMPNAVDSV